MTTFIPEEFRQFCESTTVRGIPRMLKAKNRVVFLLWLIAVVICTSALIWQLYVIFSRFMSYPVNTLLTQSDFTESPPFPDITLCNANPFVNDKSLHPSFINYSRKISSELYNRTKFTENGIIYSETDFLYFQKYLLTPPAYFSNFPIFDSFSDDGSVILDCSFSDWEYNYYNLDCLGRANANWNSDYYKCYTLRLNATERTNIRGFTAILYVEEYNDSRITKFYSGITSRSVSGARVMVHPPGTIPDMKTGISMSPGLETKITITARARSRLGKPYSNCTDKVYKFFDGTNLTYTTGLCADICSQEKIINACGCMWGGAQSTFQHASSTNLTICGNISKYSTDYSMSFDALRNFNCGLSIMAVRYECFNKMCVFPCNDNSYSSSVSSVIWPHHSTELSFYKTYLANNTRFGDMFDAYKVLLEQAKSGKNSESLALESLNFKDQIRSRFLQLKILMNDYTFDKIMDVPAYPVAMMGSNIGGTLSLWLGVTVMLLFEFLESVLMFMIAKIQKKDQPHEDTSTTVNREATSSTI